MISEETDLLEPNLLSELICHIGTLASVYHKPPATFIENPLPERKALPARTGSISEVAPAAGGGINKDFVLTRILYKQGFCIINNKDFMLRGFGLQDMIRFPLDPFFFLSEFWESWRLCLRNLMEFD